MLTGFEKIIEERILQAQKKGTFDNLPGAGKPITYEDDRMIPEELRLAYKILKNADCLPPEIEMRKEIERTEDLLSDVNDAEERYKLLKKLNFMIMKLNASRSGKFQHDMPQKYLGPVAEKLAVGKKGKS